MTLRPSLPDYNELMSMPHSYENCILLQDSIASTQQVAFIANKSKFNSPDPNFLLKIESLHPLRPVFI